MPHSLFCTGKRRTPLWRFAATALLLSAACVANLPASQAQVTGGFSLVSSFGGSRGSAKFPYAPLVQDAAGNFYGTTRGGGGNQAGTVFSLTPAGTLSNFFAFNGNDGAGSVAPLVLDAADNFYGTTEQGGFYGNGTVFAVSPGGAQTVLHDFGGRDDGASPEAGLVFGPDGNLYGTTANGGFYGNGAVFRVAADGTGYTVVYDFGSTNDDAAAPESALIVGTDGNFYGTTYYGGFYDHGTVYQLTTGGVETVLHDFDGNTGANPDTALLQANDGNFYGVTTAGGPYNAGTVFRITTSGALVTLYNFPNKNDGLDPEGDLIQATDGLLYGTTYYGGTAGGGTVYSLALDGGGFTTQHSFAGGNGDGANPVSRVIQARDGTLYGTTAYGGTNRVGAAYRLALGLPGTAQTVSAAAKGKNTAVFGGHNARFLISRTGADLSQPLTVEYLLGGTAANGVDYRRLPGAVTIPAGADSVRVPVTPLFEATQAKSVGLALIPPTDGAYTLGTSQGGTVEIIP